MGKERGELVVNLINQKIWNLEPQILFSPAELISLLYWTWLQIRCHKHRNYEARQTEWKMSGINKLGSDGDYSQPDSSWPGQRYWHYATSVCRWEKNMSLQIQYKGCQLKILPRSQLLHINPLIALTSLVQLVECLPRQPKDHWFDSQSWHILGYGFNPWLGCIGEATDR